PALLGLAGRQGPPAVAAGQESLAAIEQQAALELGRSLRMAAVAVLDQQRPHLRLEELQADLIRVRRRGRPGEQRNRHERESPASRHRDGSEEVNRPGAGVFKPPHNLIRGSRRSLRESGLETIFSRYRPCCRWMV